MGEDGAAPSDMEGPAPADKGGVAPSDEEVVQTAAEAAEALVFSRIDRSDVEDLDVTVTFEDGILELDVYLNAESALADPDQVAEDAVLAGRAAVDELLE